MTQFKLIVWGMHIYFYTLKRCDLDDVILEFANRLLNDNVKPEQWSEIDMLPLPKTGDLSDIGN